jgi:putative membrane protein (TIGR04086 family)
MAYVSLGVSAVVCGMFFGGGRGKNGFAWGTLGGLAMFALCFAVTLISGGFTGTEFLPKLISSAVCGCIGGIIGVNIAAER